MAESGKKPKLKTTHAEYSAYLSSWLLFKDAYYGEGGFDDGTYLVPHPTEMEGGEPNDAFKKRMELAYYLNYSDFVIDSKYSHLFKKPVARSTPDKNLKTWLDNVDGKGMALGDFLKEADLAAQIYGHVWIFGDRPQSPELQEKMQRTGSISKADEVAANVKTYLYWVPPTRVMDWHLDEFGNLEWVKVQEYHYIYDGMKFGESSPLVEKKLTEFLRIWTTEEVHLFRIQGDEATAEIPVVKHNLGRVPAVILYNKDGKAGELSGRSEIHDIAKVNRRIYNVCSELDEWLRNQAFSILTIPKHPDDKLPTDGKVGVGTNRALIYNSQSSHSPQFISADAEHAHAYENRLAKLVEEILRLAHMKFKGGVVQSGTAWAFDWEEVNNSLKAQAHLLREAEQELVELWQWWEEGGTPTKPVEYQAEYPETYSYSDEETEVAMLRDISLMKVPSDTFMRELMKNRVRRLLPNLTREQLEIIDQEISSWTPTEEPEWTPESNFDRFIEGQGTSTRKREMDGKEVPPSESTGKNNSGKTINP